MATDKEIFEAAGFTWSPAGGGNYSWQKTVAPGIIAQASDWDLADGVWLFGFLADDGATLAYNFETDAARAVELSKAAPARPYWQNLSIDRSGWWSYL